MVVDIGRGPGDQFEVRLFEFVVDVHDEFERHGIEECVCEGIFHVHDVEVCDPYDEDKPKLDDGIQEHENGIRGGYAVGYGASYHGIPRAEGFDKVEE